MALTQIELSIHFDKCRFPISHELRVRNKKLVDKLKQGDYIWVNSEICGTDLPVKFDKRESERVFYSYIHDGVVYNNNCFSYLVVRRARTKEVSNIKDDTKTLLSFFSRRRK